MTGTLVTIVRCAYCFRPKDFSVGFHDCPQAQAAKQRLEVAVSGIKTDILHPGQRQLTEDEKARRVATQQHVVGTHLILGIAVKPEYQNGNN